MHVPIFVVFRKHEVHRVAGGLIIEPPLKPSAIERQLVEQIVDNRRGHFLIARGIQSIIGEIIIPRAFFVRLDAVVDEMIAHLAADQVVISGDIRVGEHVVVHVRRRAERMVAQIFQIGLKARHIGCAFVHEFIEQQHIAFQQLAGSGVEQRNAHIGVVQVMVGRFKIWHGVNMHAS